MWIMVTGILMISGRRRQSNFIYVLPSVLYTATKHFIYLRRKCKLWNMENDTTENKITNSEMTQEINVFIILLIHFF